MFKNYPLSLYKRAQIKTTNDIRKSFLEYFSANDHLVLPSSNLVPPIEDQSLHFTAAGKDDNEFINVISLIISL